MGLIGLSVALLLAASAAAHPRGLRVPPQETTVCMVAETIPLTNFTLPLVEGGILTHEALIGLTDGATESLDITVMYWNMLPSADDDDLTPGEDDALGSERGIALYAALERAAARGVAMRFLQAGTSVPSQLQDLVDLHPDQVAVGLWNAGDWYGGGGIMHQKIWVADGGARVYVGSANMDWLSLSQVKELGIDCAGSANMGAAAKSLFDSWWGFAAQKASAESLAHVWSDEFLTYVDVPCWSPMVPAAQQCADPLPQPVEGYPTWEAQVPLRVDDEGGDFFLSASPQALMGGSGGGPSRTWDLDGLTRTIRTAEKYVHLSVMDFIPSSLYSGGHGSNAVWWPALFDALIAAVSARPDIQVRLLISQWAHTDPRILPYLRSLRDAAGACHSGGWNGDLCAGNLEIRIFQVPGWDATSSGPLPQVYPGYSRVNHAKYIVTEQRANIGTSNMAWAYFYQTAGTSLNTDDEDVRSTVEAIFSRDWSSDYAMPLD